MSTKSIGEEIASMTREFLDTLGKNGIEIPILPQMTEWEEVRSKVALLEKENHELREALHLIGLCNLPSPGTDAYRYWAPWTCNLARDTLDRLKKGEPKS